MFVVNIVDSSSLSSTSLYLGSKVATENLSNRNSRRSSPYAFSRIVHKRGRSKEARCSDEKWVRSSSANAPPVGRDLPSLSLARTLNPAPRKRFIGVRKAANR